MPRRPAAILAFALLLGCEAAPVAPQGSTIAVPPGENAVLSTVYWIRRNPCESMLVDVSSVSPTAGNMEGIELSVIRGATVQPWQCPGLNVPGARIAIRQTRPFTAPESRNIQFSVAYATREGPQVSRHAASLEILPASAPSAPAMR